MKRVGTLLNIILIALVAAGPFGFAAEKGPSEQELEKISSAAPERPRVAPEKPRKLLIFSKSYGYYHTSIPYGQAAFRIIKIEQPNHPVAAAFTEPTFTITEETYQFKAPYSRQKLRVLLSIDNSKTMVKLDHVSWIHRRDYDFAVSWVKSYGKGRVFYCAVGHEHEHFWNPVILQHYLDGIQFALGDLKADTTPKSKTESRGKKSRQLRHSNKTQLSSL